MLRAWEGRSKKEEWQALSKVSEVGEVNMVKEQLWLKPRKGAVAQDEVSKEGKGWVTQGPADQGKHSGLFCEVDPKENTKCPEGRTKFHPE